MSRKAAIAIICEVPAGIDDTTRLIETLGREQAANLSRAFLIDLSATVITVAEEVGAVAYALCGLAEAAELSRFLPSSFRYVPHGHMALGRVLDSAVADLLARGHDCVVLVNGACPTLPAALLQEAIAALRRSGERAVFGPALDGGYTFVALKARCSSLFEAIPWTRATVLARSIEHATRSGLPVTVVAPWYEVDDEDSLAWLVAELRGMLAPGLTMRGAAAPETLRALARGP